MKLCLKLFLNQDILYELKFSEFLEIVNINPNAKNKVEK